MKTETLDIAPLKYIDQIVALKIQMFKEAGYDSLLAENAEEIIQNDYRVLYISGTARHFIRREGDKVIAMAGAFIKEELPFRYYRNNTYGFIGDVYVKPEYRGKGLAASLSKSCIQWLKEKNITMVRLLATDAGRPIYEKLGFKPSDEMVLLI